MTVRIGSVTLPNPVMTASGTAGHGAELAPYVDLGALGAVVVKSLAAFAWAGNPAPRLHPTPAGMLNAVGLQGPGVAAWLRDDLPGLLQAGARVVASIWGRTVEEYRAAADLLARAPAEVVAVEVNLSCPEPGGPPAHVLPFGRRPPGRRWRPQPGAGAPGGPSSAPRPTSFPTSPLAARDGGAEAVTLVNTLLGLVLDPRTGRAVLGNGGGGLSGPAIRPVAVRAVFDVAAAAPDLPIVGVGGVATGEHAAELLLAGAGAVQVGTATFADPRAPARVLAELQEWAADRGLASVGQAVAAAHRGGLP